MTLTSWYWLALPAALALLLKLGFLYYVRTVRTADVIAILYMVFVAFLAVQNIAEVSHFYKLANGVLPTLEATVFYMAIVLACAAFVALSVYVSFAEPPRWARNSAYVFAVTAVLCVVLLVSGGWLIERFVSIGYSVTRVPGPGFFMLEAFVYSAVLFSFMLLLRGAAWPSSPRRQIMNTYMLIAIAPLGIMAVVVLLLLRAGILINATVVGPIATTFFLALTLYAITARQYFFELPLPSRRRFQMKLRALIDRLPQYQTVPVAINAVAENLNCTAGLFDYGVPIVSRNRDPKVNYEHAQPEFQAAFAPGRAQGQNGRIVFTDGFEERIVTRTDYDLVDRLIDRINSTFTSGLCTPEVELMECKARMAAARDALKTPKHIARQYIDEGNTSVTEYIKEVETEIYNEAISRNDGNLTKAAAVLGLNPTTFHYRIRKLGIATPNPKRQSRRRLH